MSAPFPPAPVIDAEAFEPVMHSRPRRRLRPAWVDVAALAGFMSTFGFILGVFLAGLWWVNVAEPVIERPAVLPACPTEDSDNCYWDSATGRDLISWQGRVFLAED